MTVVVVKVVQLQVPGTVTDKEEPGMTQGETRVLQTHMLSHLSPLLSHERIQPPPRASVKRLTQQTTYLGD